MWSAPARARAAWASAQWATSCRSIIRWLVPGINADYFGPFGLDYNLRKSPTLEFVDYLYAAYGEKQPFSFHGKVHRTDSAHLAVTPFQRPHPPLWMMSRDPETLGFCAKHGINSGYFLIYPRHDAAPRYTKFLDDWKRAGWPRKPNIAYCTVVYVDEAASNRLATISEAPGSPRPVNFLECARTRSSKVSPGCAGGIRPS